MEETKHPLIVIDVDAVLRNRVPGLRRWLPRFVVRGVERLIHQDGMNALLRHNYGRRGVSFCQGVLDDLEIRRSVKNADLMAPAADHRVVYVSNHPLGGLDGMALIEAVGRRHGCEPYFVVNDLLSAVEPLSEVFVPVNKHGAQHRSLSARLDEAFASDRPVIVFPAGLVSRKGKNGRIADLPWNKMFVGKCIRHGRNVQPLYFEGYNSPFFYNFAKNRVRLGLKFNYEMILLPSEMFKAKGSSFNIVAGRRIDVEELVKRSVDDAVRLVRDAVYSLA